mgnify:CR=1 FL=1
MCTGIKITAHDSSIIYARTLEFGREFTSDILMVPVEYTLTSITGARWKSRYSVIGANFFKEIHYADGVNSAGLAGGLFYFPGYAHYQEPVSGKSRLAPWELLTWILTQYSTVQEVRAALLAITVNSIEYPGWQQVPPIHAIVHDSRGNSLVIEYVEGQLQMHDNPLGVFTNSPNFKWHLINLNNYTRLSSINSTPAQWGPLILTPAGQGSGLLGLPGDFTPPSRFVRAAFFSHAVTSAQNALQARDTAFHILNLFDIPAGVVQEQQNTGVFQDYTQWTSACDLKNKIFYWHTYQNRQIRSVSITDVNNIQKIVMRAMG